MRLCSYFRIKGMYKRVYDGFGLKAPDDVLWDNREAAVVGVYGGQWLWLLYVVRDLKYRGGGR
ncbi:hypothetical protein C5167_050204 [Papaver somniferum]|uniref:Uncharacterized protein n=1 Tax=Papaver somniferum TaxID=3469 RepID=A0A4Y7KN08_PAPSO|nr:hypothetical protein C5167_050204 [Papaver somniferum]